jgi:SAM-dependent methyltransferase
MLTVQQLWEMEIAQLKLERETTDPDSEIWRWSPLEITEFERMLQIAHSLAVSGNVRLRGESGGLRRLSFAEAGSGIGTKLYLAKNKFNLDEWGFEVNKDYIAQARELEVRTVECDLRTENPPWAKFDIVYVSRPFKDDAVEVAWEEKVMRDMRLGAVYISAYAAVKPYAWPCYYRASFRGVWVKSDQGQYSHMIQRSATGTDPLVPEPLSR